MAERPFATWKAFLLILVCFAVWLAVAFFGFGCGPVRPETQPKPPLFNEVVARSLCQRIWQEELLRPIDPPALTACVDQQRHGVTEPTLRAQVRDSDEYRDKHQPTPTVVARKGIVRANGPVLLDDDGPALFLGGSLFWAHWGYEHDRARLEKNLAWLQAHGTDYIRVILSAKWGTVAPDPRSPNWEATLSALLDLVYMHGMRTEITIFGWDDPTPTKDSRRKAVEAVARVAAAKPEKVFAIETVNEWFTNFPPETLSEVRDLTRYLQTHTRNLVAVSAPRTDSCEEQAKLYGGNVGSLVSLHFSRAFTGDGPWRPVRQPWRESRFKCDGVASAYIDNERIGPQSSVNSDDDPLRLASGCGVSWTAGIGACTAHTGAGISGQLDPARHRPPNVFETDRIEPILKAITATRTALPADLAGWQKDASRPTRAFTLSDTDWDRIDHGRFYCAYKGVQFTCIPFAMSRPIAPVTAKPMRVRVIHPETGVQLQDVTLAKGQKLTLSGTPAAVILRGEFK